MEPTDKLLDQMEHELAKPYLHDTPQVPLYHYTNGEGLLGTMQDRQIWATHFRDLNDRQELLLGEQIHDGVFHAVRAGASGRALSALLFGATLQHGGLLKRSVHAVVLLAGVGLAACGGTTTATRRQFDDASTSSGGTTSSPGSGGTTGSSGGSTSITDASAPGIPLPCPSSPSITNIAQTSLSQTPVRPGTGGTPAVGGLDAGLDGEGHPTDPCVTYASPACPGGPRSIFGCPTVRGPSGSSTIHAGDQITVTVPMSDEGLASYSCFGIDSNNALVGGYYLTYAVKPAYAEATGQVAPDTKPSTMIHFSAEASGSGYTTGPGTACSNDLTRLDFDVTVGR